MSNPEQKVKEMSASDRRSLIANLVLEKGRVNISDLVDQFQITETSLRRDLIILESNGQLKRVHGGAVSVSGNSRIESFVEKMHLNNNAKERIGAAAAQMIKPRNVVLFDSGTTTLQIVKKIPAELRLSTSITMVTNSMPVSQEVLAWPAPNLIILGGIYLPDYQATAGPQTLQQLQDLTADIVFLGTDGLTVEGGVSTVNILMAEVDRMMTERARKVVLVVDSSKLGRISFVPVKPVTAFHLIITDTNADPEMVEKIREQGVEVLLV